MKADKFLEEYKELVSQEVAAYCCSEYTQITNNANDSKHSVDDIFCIGKSIKELGKQLDVKVLSGGHTNYSFKITVKDYALHEVEDEATGKPVKNKTKKKPQIPMLFAKLAFNFALWDRDRTPNYDLKRTENEFLIMERFSKSSSNGGQNKLLSAVVVKPYFCIDVKLNVSDESTDGETQTLEMKLLVTEWAKKSDEQFSNQFIDGEVDERIVTKAARTFAALNLVDGMDPDFNSSVRPCMSSLFPVLKQAFQQYVKDHAADGDTTDHPFLDTCLSTAKKYIGVTEFNKIVDDMEVAYNRRDIFIHSDSHPLNILVEPKPKGEQKSAGTKGGMFICDWEMCMVGPIGRDVGFFQSWPIACAIAHAVLGHKAEAYHILMLVTEQFWNIYAQVLVHQGKKDDVYLAHVFRDALGWNGFLLFVCFYLSKLHNEELPLEGASNNEKTLALGCIGDAGLRFMHLGFRRDFEPALTLRELRDRQRSLLHGTIDRLLEVNPGSNARPRQPSSLRASGRRISDGFGLDEQALRRLSCRQAGTSEIVC